MCFGIARSELLALIALFACLWGCSSGPATSPELPARAQRICSVSLAGDELLSLLVDNERIACVSSMADDAESSNVADLFPSTIPRIPAKVEPVLSVKPDLVLAAPWNNSNFLNLIRETGVAVLILDPGSDLPSIRDQLLDLGERLGESERAAEHASRFDARLAAVRDALPEDSSPRVLSFSHLIVAGAGTSPHAMIEAAGGVNAAGEIGLEGHEKVSIETILGIDPDVLLLGFDPGQGADAVLNAYPQLALTRAVKQGRIVLMPPRRLTTVTPFIVEGVEQLANDLHAVPAGAGS